jgi:hypothetical protein
LSSASRSALTSAARSLIGNNGYRRFVTSSAAHWHVNKAKVAEESEATFTPRAADDP